MTDNEPGTAITNSEPGTTNDPDTTSEPGTAKRGPGRPPGSPNKYHYREYDTGTYSNVTLHLDKKVWAAIRIMAIKEETPITELVSEALATWLKWLARAAREEKENGPTELELLEVNKLYQAVMKKQHTRKLANALQSRAHWHRTYPTKRWPGKEGKDVMAENREPGTGNAV